MNNIKYVFGKTPTAIIISRKRCLYNDEDLASGGIELTMSRVRTRCISELGSNFIKIIFDTLPIKYYEQCSL